MAKFQLQAGETLIGKGPMSLYQKQGLTKKPFQGKIYVTDQRVCFYMDLSGTLLWSLHSARSRGSPLGPYFSPLRSQFKAKWEKAIR